MKNIKSDIYNKLVTEFGAEHVTDQFPTDWSNLPAVQYTEEENKVHEYDNGGEAKSYVRYRIDIWETASTSASAVKVDKALGSPRTEANSYGLERTSCSDVSDPGSHLRHKMMRYEGVIDTESNNIYWA